MCTFPQMTSVALVNTVYLARRTVWKLFTFQSEVKYFQERLVCLLICFVHFISVFDSCPFTFLSATPCKDSVDVSETCHLNICSPSLPMRQNLPSLVLVGRDFTGSASGGHGHVCGPGQCCCSSKRHNTHSDTGF